MEKKERRIFLKGAILGALLGLASSLPIHKALANPAEKTGIYDNYIVLPSLNSDPTSLDKGMIWFRGDLGKFRCSRDGVNAEDLIKSLNLGELGDVEISSPSDGEVLTYEGATGKWKNKPASGGGGTPSGNEILEALQRHLGVWWFNNHWHPSGMLTNGASGSGSINWGGYFLRLNTGTTTDSYAYVYKDAFGLSGGASWGKKRWFGIYVYFATYAGQNIHIVSGGFPVTSSANSYEHIGFKLINGDLYGTVADGATEATLLLETLTEAVYRRLECVLDPTVPECRFYVDGEDKGAITSNLPTGTTNARRMLGVVIHNTEAVNKYFEIYEARTFQEE